MNDNLRYLNDMEDTKELLEAKPNPIIPLFIYLILFIITAALIWSYFGEIDEVVKTKGVIQTNNNISTVRNLVSSKVETVNYLEGQHVKEGDVLLTFANDDLIIQRESLEETQKNIKNKIEDLTILKESIETGSNLFGEKSPETESYKRFVLYQSNISLIDKEYEGVKQEVDQKRKEQEYQKNILDSQLEELNRHYKQLEKLKKSIEDNTNLFSKEESLYFNRYQDYSMNVTKLEEEIQEKKQIYTDLKEQSIELTKEKLLEAEKSYETDELNLRLYRNQFILQIDKELIEVKSQLDANKLTLNTDYNITDIEDHGKYELSKEKVKNEMLLQVEEEISEFEKQLTTITSELEILDKKAEEYVIKTPINGIVNVRTTISKGDFLQSGTEILNILPDGNSSTYKVQLSLLNKDIASINIGDKVNFRVHSLPYQEYGQYSGEISKISSNTYIDQVTGESYYIIEATVDNKPVFGYKNEKEFLKVGMTTDAHIITHSTKILYKILEKINFLD
jgi:membrane fusion protein, peptide pheromone/bacteriocin exporter